jgi:hypothetical protein
MGSALLYPAETCCTKQGSYATYLISWICIALRRASEYYHNQLQ